jgi:dihydroxyacetone synthase
VFSVPVLFIFSSMAPSAVSAVESLPTLPVKGTLLKTGDQNGSANIQLEDAELGDRVLRTFRCLIADLCEQFKGGHPGGAMGMAAIGVALWKYSMKYSPENPNFFNRDRFVLSNGKF